MENPARSRNREKKIIAMLITAANANFLSANNATTTLD